MSMSNESIRMERVVARVRPSGHPLREQWPSPHLPREQVFDLANHRRIRAWISIVRSQSL